MTPQEYKALKRRPIEEWTMAECIAADDLVKQVTLETLRIKLRQYPAEVASFIQLMVRAHFGSAEVDEFLNDLQCFPDWI